MHNIVRPYLLLNSGRYRIKVFTHVHLHYCIQVNATYPHLLRQIPLMHTHHYEQGYHFTYSV